MSDWMERAQELEQRQRDDALLAHQRLAPLSDSATHCMDCDEPIPSARRLAVAGVQRCIDCQETSELRSKYAR